MVEEITIPESVVEIGDYAFLNCNSLEEINFGFSDAAECKLAKIGNEAFARPKNAQPKDIDTIWIPSSVK